MERREAGGIALLKWVLGAGGALGTVFWAGATYQRVSAIESHLEKIDASLGVLSDLGALKTRTSALETHMERLDQRFDALRGDDARDYGRSGNR